MKFKLNVRSNVYLFICLSLFLLLIPPFTHYSSLILGSILSIFIFLQISNIEIEKISVLELAIVFLIVFYFYALVRGIGASDTYLAILELVAILLGLCVFIILSNFDVKDNTANVIAVLAIIYIGAFAIYFVKNVNIFTYGLMQNTQIESKNPIALRVAFLCYLVGSILIVENNLKSTAKFFLGMGFLISFSILIFMESSRSIIFLIISFLIFGLLQDAGRRTILIIIMSTTGGLLFFYDEFSTALSKMSAVSLLFWKLEPYIPGVNAYGELSGGGYARAKFSEDAIEIAYIGIAERPYWGWGPNNSRLLFLREMGIPTNSHNNVYELLVNYGIVGSCLWFGFAVMYALNMLSCRKSNYFPFSLGLICGISFISILSPIYREADIYVMLGIAVLLLKSRKISNEQSDPIRN